MKLSKHHKQFICIMFSLAIVLSGTCTGISQGNVFFACRNIPEEAQISSVHEEDLFSHHNKSLNDNSSSQKYQVTHTSFAKEDCRIEDNSVRTLRKVNSACGEKRGNRGRTGNTCIYPEWYHDKCLKRIQNQYIERSKSIETINKIVISYIHQKDGAKGVSLFF